MKGTLARDGATTVEAKPMTFMHNVRFVVSMHGKEFIAAGSQQCLDSLNQTMENNFRTKSVRIIGPNCSQMSGKFFRRTVEFAGGACWWARRQNLAEAEDSVSEVESKNFQSLDDPAIQFEMAMVLSGRCKPTVGAARLRPLPHRQTYALMEVQA